MTELGISIGELLMGIIISIFTALSGFSAYRKQKAIQSEAASRNQHEEDRRRDNQDVLRLLSELQQKNDQRQEELAALRKRLQQDAETHTRERAELNKRITDLETEQTRDKQEISVLNRKLVEVHERLDAAEKAQKKAEAEALQEREARRIEEQGRRAAEAQVEAFTEALTRIAKAVTIQIIQQETENPNEESPTTEHASETIGG